MLPASLLDVPKHNGEGKWTEDKEESKTISLNMFAKLYLNLKTTTLKNTINQANNIHSCQIEQRILENNSKSNIKRQVHNFAKINTKCNLSKSHNVDERKAFAIWINNNLRNDEFLKNGGYLPIDPNSEVELFEKCCDGLIFIRLVKLIKPGLICDDVLNKFSWIQIGSSGCPDAGRGAHRMVIQDLNSPDLLTIENVKILSQKIENLNLAIFSAASIGCCTTRFDSSEIVFNHNPHQILELLWELIKTKLFLKIDLEKSNKTYKDLTVLFRQLTHNIHQDALYCLAPEDIILKWANHHLKMNEMRIANEDEPAQAADDHDNLFQNFSTDVKDSILYQKLLLQLQTNYFNKNNGSFEIFKNKKIIYPNYKTVSNLDSRALHTLKMADNMEAKEFLTWREIKEGNEKLNIAFMANLFNKELFLDNNDDQGFVIEKEEKQKECIKKETDKEESMTSRGQDDKSDSTSTSRLPRVPIFHIRVYVYTRFSGFLCSVLCRKYFGQYTTKIPTLIYGF